MEVNAIVGQMTSEAKVVQAIEQARAILNPELKGSDLSVLIDRLIEWVKALELDGVGAQATHVLLHFAIDELIPALVEMGPVYTDLVLTMIIIPLLRKVDERFHTS